MANRKKKGDLLEVIVATLERSLIDNNTTKITPNHKIADKDGIERELDIYFETVVNRKLFRYAIECKNYSSKTPVKLTHVTDFFMKIERSNIKGIIVTTGPVQRSAIAKAKVLGIEIYKVEKSEKPVVAEFTFHRKRHSLKRYLIFSSVMEELRKLDPIFHTEGFINIASKEKITRNQLEGKILKPDIEKYIRNNSIEIYKPFFQAKGNQFSIIGGKKRNLSIRADFSNSGLGFFYKEEIYPIEEITVEVEVWIEIRHSDNPDGFVYRNLTTGESLMEFLSYELDYGGERATLNLLTDSKDEQVKVTISSLFQKGKYLDFKELQRFRPGEMSLKYRETEEE